MNSTALYNDYIQRHEITLHQIIQEAAIPATPLKEALAYSLFPGGKRIRPLLVYLCGEMVQANMESLDVIAAAVELIHAYSLIHDDLPAMDNDDFRRGKPSCHRAFGEATAILVGDGMQALANTLLLTKLPTTLPLTNVIQITQTLAEASGFNGMVSGQSLDLTELSQPSITETKLEQIHHLKTGALFSSCVNMALLAGTPDRNTCQRLQQFAQTLGVAFQMQDDYNDRYETHRESGKKRASDEANNKLTFASLYNRETLFNAIEQHYHFMLTTLNAIGEPAQRLILLTQQLQQRTQP